VDVDNAPVSVEALASVTEMIRNCTLCPLCASRRRVVPGEGPVPARLMIVGEGPGSQEDHTGRPFVGAAGRLLDRILSNVGIDRSACFVTNAVKCRPPDNRTPTQDECAACWVWTERLIDAVDPDIIITLGATALSLFDPARHVTRDHGHAFWWQARMILPTYHPSAALHDPTKEDPLWTDLARFSVVVQNLVGWPEHTLDEFARKGMIVRVRLEGLGVVALCSTQREADVAWEAGLTPYTSEELRMIVRAARTGLMSSTALHQMKQAFRGTLVEVEDRKGVVVLGAMPGEVAAQETVREAVQVIGKEETSDVHSH